MGGGCADPRAANYDAAAFPRRDGAAAAADVAADGDADGYGAVRALRASGTTLEALSLSFQGTARACTSAGAGSRGARGR